MAPAVVGIAPGTASRKQLGHAFAAVAVAAEAMTT